MTNKHTANISGESSIPKNDSNTKREDSKNIHKPPRLKKDIVLISFKYFKWRPSLFFKEPTTHPVPQVIAAKIGRITKCAKLDPTFNELTNSVPIVS